MSEVLVVVEHADGTVKKVTSELLTLARTLGEPSAVWIGPGYSDAAAAALGEFGAAKVYVADGAQYVDHPVAPRAEVLANLVSEHAPSAVLIASSADGKETAGRLAIKINSGVITDAIGISAEGIATQSVFGGSTVVHSKVIKGTPIFTVRPNSTPPVPATSTPIKVDVTVSVSELAMKAKVTGRTVAQKDGRPDLSEAAIVVSGGRGVGAAEGFAVIEAIGSPTPWARPLVPRGRQPMPGGTRINTRWVRPARRYRPSFMWPTVSPALSSTGPECRLPRLLLWSIRIPKHRFLSSRTSA